MVHEISEVRASLWQAIQPIPTWHLAHALLLSSYQSSVTCNSKDKTISNQFPCNLISLILATCTCTLCRHTEVLHQLHGLYVCEIWLWEREWEVCVRVAHVSCRHVMNVKVVLVWNFIGVKVTSLLTKSANIFRTY